VTVTYDRDDDKRRIVIKIAGPFDLSATLAIVAHLAADASRWSYGILYDAHDLTGLPSMIDLQMVVDRVQIVIAQRPRGPVAVVTSEAAIYELARVYAHRLIGKVNVRVFRTLGDAHEWLDGYP
jgi:hypothetical protein